MRKNKEQVRQILENMGAGFVLATDQPLDSAVVKQYLDQKLKEAMDNFIKVYVGNFDIKEILTAMELLNEPVNEKANKEEIVRDQPRHSTKRGKKAVHGVHPKEFNPEVNGTPDRSA